MRIILFFTLACIFSWSVLLTGLSQAAGGFGPLFNQSADLSVAELMPWLVVASFGPMLAALLMVLFEPQPWTALKTWLARLVRIKAHPLVWAIALFILPVCALMLVFALGVGVQPEFEPVMVWLTLAIAPINGLATVIMGAGPLGEEPGWRGYALPKLLERTGPAGASLLIGVVWTLWHWPLFLVPEWAGGGNLPLQVFIPFYAVMVLSLAYVMTRLFQWSRGSVLMAIWVHGIANAVTPYMASSIWDKTGWSPVQDALFTAAPVVLAAVVVAVIARTPFARKREQSWQAPHASIEASR
jgi:membrane protease YdiL (CAAX protease family)